MFKNLETTIDINAPADKVWQVLSKLEAYPVWNKRCSFNKSARLHQWQMMRVTLFSCPLKVPVKIQRFDADAGLRWVGGIPGCYTGSHYFAIEALSDKRCRFIQGEDFNGVLVRVMWPFLETELLSLYNSMNEAIKHRAESIASQHP